MGKSTTQLAQELNQAFLRGSGRVTQLPGRADPSTRKFYSTHQGYDYGVNAGTPITPNFNGQVLQTYMDKSGFGLRQLVQNNDTGEKFYLSHLSKPIIQNGSFSRGQTISLTGGKFGSYGAGNTTGAHLDVTPYSQMIAGINNGINYARSKINLKDYADQARSKYGNSVKYVGVNKSKLDSIAKILGGKLVKL